MDKRLIICAITAALLGGGLVWAADHRAQDSRHCRMVYTERRNGAGAGCSG